MSVDREQDYADFDAEVDALIEHAEAALQGEAVSVPDTIYSGLQEAGWFSADPVIDADPEIAAKANSLLQLVKEFSVSPSGNWEIALTDREIQAVSRGDWCPNCYSPQRFSDAEWEERMQRLEERIGPRPDGASRECNCPVCGFQLGIHGVVEADPIGSMECFTPEQVRLIEEFFLGKFSLDEEAVDADGE